MGNPLSRREVIKFGAYTTVGGALMPGVSLAQAIATDTKDITAREVQIPVGGATKGNPNVELVLYPGAQHAFFSDDRPQVYKKDAAEDAWKRCVAFFDKHLKV